MASYGCNVEQITPNGESTASHFTSATHVNQLCVLISFEPRLPGHLRVRLGKMRSKYMYLRDQFFVSAKKTLETCSTNSATCKHKSAYTAKHKVRKLTLFALPYSKIRYCFKTIYFIFHQCLMSLTILPFLILLLCDDSQNAASINIRCSKIERELISKGERIELVLLLLPRRKMI